MAYHFDQVIDRRCSESAKWHCYGEGVLPMWVADMDFRSPEPVIHALHQRAEHGVFGYGLEPPELGEILVERLSTLYRWEVAPEAIVFLPGVVVGFNLACHAMLSRRKRYSCKRRSIPPSWRPRPTRGALVRRWS